MSWPCFLAGPLPSACRPRAQALGAFWGSCLSPGSDLLIFWPRGYHLGRGVRVAIGSWGHQEQMWQVVDRLPLPPPPTATSHSGGPRTGSISTPTDAHLKCRVSGLPSPAESGSRFHNIPGWFMVEKHQVSTFLKITQLIWWKRYFYSCFINMEYFTRSISNLQKSWKIQ